VTASKKTVTRAKTGVLADAAWKKSSTKKLPPLVWFEIRQSVAMTTRGDRMMGVTVALKPGSAGWAVLAFETSAKPSSSGDGYADFFADHAHEVVGEARTKREAKILAKAYQKKWFARGAPTTPCPCEEIKAPSAVAE
jgi:hypothetical protein